MTYYAPEPEGISHRRKVLNRTIIKATSNTLYWYTRHWLFLINVLMSLIVGLVFLAPYLMSLGLDAPASAIYTGYSPFCHQMPSRSFFMFGYQMAVCQRNIAIFSATLLAGLAFTPLRGHVKPLPWWLLVLFTLPIAIDGFTQLFGWRESTWELRLITGSLFGLGGVWLAYPMIEQACRRTRFLLEAHPWR